MEANVSAEAMKISTDHQFNPFGRCEPNPLEYLS